MQTRRWLNQSQPQTLVIAVILLYFTAASAVLFFDDGPMYAAALCGWVPSCGNVVDLLRLLVAGGALAAGYGIANEQRWAYHLGVVVAAAPLAARLVFSVRLGVSPLEYRLVSLLFEVALLALLLHPQSRDYQRIWFSGRRRAR
jgi:hypothetical protein